LFDGESPLGGDEKRSSSAPAGWREKRDRLTVFGAGLG
jgi:hypothetical protein